MRCTLKDRRTVIINTTRSKIAKVKPFVLTMSVPITNRVKTVSHGNDDLTAYETNNQVFKGGLTKQEIAKYYNQWAEGGSYDMHLCPTRYTGPEHAAMKVAEFFPREQRPTLRVLDVAAGTGRIGSALYEKGFRLIEALDPSEGMLKKAMERGVYTNFINDFIGDDNRVPVIDGYYDAIACSGGFGSGHIPSSALHEMIRIVRKGGLICIAMREEYIYLDEYRTSLLPLIQHLEAKGKWKLTSKDLIDNYFLDKTGISFQFENL